MSITPQSAWRGTGDTDAATFTRAIARTWNGQGQSPMAADAAAIYAAVSAHGLARLAVAIAWEECKDCTWPQCGVPAAAKNPWAVTGKGDAGSSGRWAAYTSYAKAAEDWATRLLSPSGPYAGAKSILELLNIYAPSSDGNDPTAYAQRVCGQINALPLAGDQPTPPPTPGGYNFGPHPWPAGFDRRILPLPPDGQGWDGLGPRASGMCATFCHISDGYDDRDSVWNLFGPNGERFRDAKTEGVIDRTGNGYLMLDPWSADPKEGSGVTPWASGTTDGLEGAGIPYVQQLGANAVNKRGFATEHSNKEGQTFTDPQMDLSAKVHAVVISRERIPWDKWPYNPNVGNLYVAMKHRDISSKSCPGWVWNADFHTHWVAAVAHEAKVLQTGSAPPGPVTPPEPPPQPNPFPFDFTQAQVAGFWGTLRRRMSDGSIKPYPFDPAGSLGAMWLARARTDGTMPAALDWWEEADGRHFVTFGTPGDVDWVLTIPSINTRADWHWVDRPPTT